MITVVIPTTKADEIYLKRTIESVRKTAVSPIEIMVLYDGFVPRKKQGDVYQVFEKPIGIRAGLNIAAKCAKGDYIVKLDAHCALSQRWDVRMKHSCRDKTIVTTIVDTLDEKTWQGKGRDMSFVTLDGNLKIQYVKPWIPKSKRKQEEETLAFIGCFIMLKKDYLIANPLNEQYGFWGNLGAELSLRTWLTGGRVILRTDVTCAHLFRKTTPFEIDIKRKKRAIVDLVDKYIKQVKPSWLLDHFGPYECNGFYDIPIFGIGGAYTVRKPDMDLLRNFVNKYEIETVLEFGSGKSTIMFELAGCRIISKETEQGLAQILNMITAPHASVEYWQGELVEGDFDLVFIDGPAGGVNRDKSYEAASKVNAKYIACHDMNRRWEQRWKKIYFPERKCVFSNHITEIYA